MYKVLNKKERDNFVNKYFKSWKKDIWKVSCLTYENHKEYLINDHYLFVI